MKKHSSLAERVRRAQEVFNSWPEDYQKSFRLEGSSATLARFAPDNDASNAASAAGRNPHPTLRRRTEK